MFILQVSTASMPATASGLPISSEDKGPTLVERALRDIEDKHKPKTSSPSGENSQTDSDAFIGHPDDPNKKSTVTSYFQTTATLTGVAAASPDKTAAIVAKVFTPANAGATAATTGAATGGKIAAIVGSKTFQVVGGRVLPVVGALIATYDVLRDFYNIGNAEKHADETPKQFNERKQKLRTDAYINTGCTAVGAIAGGIVGSIIPGFGTAIGAFVGAGLGNLVGNLFKTGGVGRKIWNGIFG